MLVLGISGTIGSGKSSVSRALNERFGWPIIDADKIARAALAPGTLAAMLVHRRFGPEVFKSDGSIDRVKLREIVFCDDKNRKALNRIVHPWVILDILQKILLYYITGKDAVIVDIPLLFEGIVEVFCYRTVCVASLLDIQIKRLEEGPLKLSREAVIANVQKQMPQNEKIARADCTIWNSGSLEDLNAAVLEFGNDIPVSQLRTWINLLCPVLAFARSLQIIITRCIRRVKVMNQFHSLQKEQ